MVGGGGGRVRGGLGLPGPPAPGHAEGEYPPRPGSASPGGREAGKGLLLNAK